ncbi:hypothetical protein [Bdellovibrio bacteriovorus]|uniref:hypothetical protein n=1 Tax=Bdellovibrio bacteriovorus TaxID=959 RepID=UPI0035A5E916
MKKMLIVLSMLLTASLAQAQAKVGFVDMQKAIQSTSAGKKAKRNLKQSSTKRKKSWRKKKQT